MVIRHVFLRENALDLLEVPIRDVSDLVDFLRGPPDMLILAIGSTDAETVPVVVALPVHGRVRESLPLLPTFIEAVSTVFPGIGR